MAQVALSVGRFAQNLRQKREPAVAVGYALATPQPAPTNTHERGVYKKKASPKGKPFKELMKKKRFLLT